MTSRSAIRASVSARPWVSTNPMTTSTPSTAERVRVFDHRIGLADARRGADVDAQAGMLLGLQLRQHLFTGGSALL